MTFFIGLRNALILSLALWALIFYAIAHAQQPPQQPCVRTQHAPGTPDLDVTHCQMALDAQKMGELQSQLSAATATLALVNQDLAKASAKAAAAERKVKEWQEYARPLYETKPGGVTR